MLFTAYNNSHLFETYFFTLLLFLIYLFFTFFKPQWVQCLEITITMSFAHKIYILPAFSCSILSFLNWIFLFYCIHNRRLFCLSKPCCDHTLQINHDLSVSDKCSDTQRLWPCLGCVLFLCRAAQVHFWCSAAGLRQKEILPLEPGQMVQSLEQMLTGKDYSLVFWPPAM